jgi:hypothetical protein
MARKKKHYIESRSDLQAGDYVYHLIGGFVYQIELQNADEINTSIRQGNQMIGAMLCDCCKTRKATQLMEPERYYCDHCYVQKDSKNRTNNELQQNK